MAMTEEDLRWQSVYVCQGCVKDQLLTLWTAFAEDIFYTTTSHRCERCNHDAREHNHLGEEYHLRCLEKGGHLPVLKKPAGFLCGYMKAPLPTVHGTLLPCCGDRVCLT